MARLVQFWLYLGALWVLGSWCCVRKGSWGWWHCSTSLHMWSDLVATTLYLHLNWLCFFWLDLGGQCLWSSCLDGSGYLSLELPLVPETPRTTLGLCTGGPAAAGTPSTPHTREWGPAFVRKLKVAWPGLGGTDTFTRNFTCVRC